jgi:hypothetical protein
MKKIGLLVLALVLALGTMGVGYAMWFEDLFLDVTVETGELDVQWSVHEVWDDEIEGKNFSEIRAWIDPDTGRLQIQVLNAYPCMYYYAMIDVSNVGSIPVHLCDMVYLGGTLPAGALVISDFDLFQVHPGETSFALVTIHLTNDMVPNETGENQIYNASFGLKAVQYNEPCP